MMKLAMLLVATMIVRLPGFSQQDSTASADSLLLRMVQRQMSAETPPTEPAPQPRNAMSTNPNMSVIGNFQGSYHSVWDRNFDFNMDEIEVSLQSIVDPYARADFFLSIGRNPATGSFEAGLEEGYVTTTDLPAHLQLKAGK